MLRVCPDDDTRYFADPARECTLDPVAVSDGYYREVRAAICSE
jgi:hypothetical protein